METPDVQFEPTISDAEAVQAVLAGRRDAFSVLVHRHLPVVRALAFARTNSHYDADDIAQETLLRAYKYLHTLRDASRFGCWVTAIATNAAKRVLAKRARRAEVPHEPIHKEGFTSPEVEQRDLQRFVKQQMDRLDEIHRDVLILCYLAGKTTPEAAAILGISTAAVKKRLQRARAALSRQVIAVVGPEFSKHHRDRRNREDAARIMGLVPLIKPMWTVSPSPAPPRQPATQKTLAPPAITEEVASPRHAPLAPGLSMSTSSSLSTCACALLVSLGLGTLLWFMCAAPSAPDNSPLPQVGARSESTTLNNTNSAQPHIPSPTTSRGRRNKGSLASPVGTARSSRANAESNSRPNHPLVSNLSTNMKNDAPPPPRLIAKTGEAVPSAAYERDNHLRTMILQQDQPARAPALTRRASPLPTSPRTERAGSTQLRNVPLKTALDLLARERGLTYSVEGGYVFITTPDQLRADQRNKDRLSGNQPGIPIRR